MKYLFIFLFTLLPSFLFSTFNVNTKGVGYSAVPQQEQKETLSEMAQPIQSPQGSLDLTKTMSKAEQKATGLYRLNDNQKMALAKWIESYSDASQTEEKKIKELEPNQIAAILADGRYVKTGDGSVWNVSPNGWMYTYYWRQGEFLAVEKGKDTLFPTLLRNENYPLTVNARKAASNITKSFQNAFVITEISNDGKYLYLDNQSIWEIPDSQRYMVAGWSPGNTIFVTKLPKSTGAQYKLFNGVTTRPVFANLHKQGQPLEKSPLKKLRPLSNVSDEKKAKSNESQNSSAENQSDDANRGS